ncbi:MAG: hypothetical protein ACP5NO_08435, partial [Thermoplasmata archaeon]
MGSEPQNRKPSRKHLTMIAGIVVVIMIVAVGAFVALPHVNNIVSNHFTPKPQRVATIPATEMEGLIGYNITSTWTPPSKNSSYVATYYN